MSDFTHTAAKRAEAQFLELMFWKHSSDSAAGKSDLRGDEFAINCTLKSKGLVDEAKI